MAMAVFKVLLRHWLRACHGDFHKCYSQGPSYIFRPELSLVAYMCPGDPGGAWHAIKV